MRKIRVLVVDDSAYMRKMIKELIESDHRFEVIGTARNGTDGIGKIISLKPDVVTLDIEMPVMDGITALKKIMEIRPLPVVMLSSINEKGAAATMEALTHGAVDFIVKPSGTISVDIENIRDEMVAKIHTAYTSNVSIHRNIRSSHNSCKLNQQSRKAVICVGASTGGPRALQHFLTDLPKELPAPVLIVQHMPAGFTRSLAARLDSIADIHIKEAVNGESLQNGTAYIAPGNQHMKVATEGKELSIKLTDEDPRNGHRPSVDILFESIAEVECGRIIGIILTGMGSDGAAGIDTIMKNDSGNIIVAEAEETAVVYGMPKAAVRTNHVNYMLPIHQMGRMIAHILNS